MIAHDMLTDDRALDLRTADVPRVLWIELTSKCPFDCIFCTRKSLRAEGRHMDFELYRSIIAELREPAVLRLNYSGESTHHPQIMEAIELAAATGATTELVSAFATFPEHRMERLVLSGLDRLTISLHTLDPAEFHAIYRHMSVDDMTRKIERLVQVRDALRRTKPAIDFAFVAMQRNMAQLPDVAAYASRLGIGQLFVHPIISRDPLPVRFDEELDHVGRLRPEFTDALSRVAADVAERFPDVRVDFSTPETGTPHELDGVPRYFTGALPAGARIFSCDQDPWETVHILADGEVVVCEVRDKIVLGNLHEQTLTQIWRGDAYRRFRREYVAGRPAECRTCPYKIAYRPGASADAIAAADGMNAQLLRGWHAPADGVVWSTQQSLATLAPRGTAASLRVAGVLPPAQHGAENRLDVEVDGKPLGSVLNDSRELRAFEVDLMLRRPATSPVSITFRTAAAFRPAEEGSADVRALGFAMRHVGLRERAIVPPRPPAELRRERLMTRLGVTLAVANAVRRLAGAVPRRRVPRATTWCPGVSVIVPERASPALLDDCLAHALRAARATSEPFELIVVVNGSPLEDYRELAARYPDVRWLHSAEPLSFGTAIGRGLRHARFDGVYLLNNDMMLADDALSQLLPWRAPNVFSIASQIFFVDPQRRREETGWTEFALEKAQVRLSDVEPDADRIVRGHLYAGGGSSLFRRQYLAQLQNRRDPYTPFYWEDAEWGIRAWREGYEVLFCPASQAHHHHRATISRFFAPADVERIFARNSVQFLLRNLLEGTDPRALLAIAGDRERCPDLTLGEIASVRNAVATVGAQWHTGRAPMRDLALQGLRRKYYPTPYAVTAAKPCLLLVSPYALFPPAHGGAIRIAELLQTLSMHFRVVLLSDEEALYSPQSVPYFAGLHAVHLVGGRKDRAGDAGRRIARMRSHAHARLREELRRLLACYRPDVVQVEFVELAPLIEERTGRVPWFITLHDVLFTPDAPTDDDAVERALLERYDGAIVCSAEDAALMGGPGAVDVVPNGTRMADVPYVPSRRNTSILFAGPFRYAPNLAGIRRFLKLVYPGLKRAVPALRLVVLGGDRAPEIARTIPCFAQSGVEVHGYERDVTPYLARCAVTINPLDGTRGSSIKLIESLAAGRACVSTADGARGFAAAHPSLVVVERIEDFGPPLERLLLDETYRLGLEPPAPAFKAASSWDSSAERQLGVYRRYLGNRV